MRRMFLLLLLIMPFSYVWGDTLTPGDRVFLQVPGEAAFDTPYTINDQGQLRLPEVGLINVAGLTVIDAEQHVRQKLASIYRNLDEFKLTIMEQLIRIKVLGYVEKPGTVSLKPGSNVQMALSAAGGARPGAQLDKFKLLRNSSTKIFNYKAYLDSGDQTLLPSLKGGDTIFIPASPLLGNIEMNFDDMSIHERGDADEAQGITIFGELRNPGTFSFKPNMTVVDALMRANGVTRYADVTKIRVITNGMSYRFNLSTYLETGDTSNLPPIKPGTTIFAPIEAPEKTSTDDIQGVTIFGELHKPGTFSFKPNMNVVDALMRAEGVTRYADVTKIRVITDNVPSQFDLKAYLDTGKTDNMPEVKPGTIIFVPIEIKDINTTSRTIYVMGEVKAAGPYETSPGTSFIDVLANAGGPTRFADTTNIKILSNTKAPIAINLVEYAQNPAQYTLPAMSPGDVVFIPEKVDLNEKSWLKVTNDRAIKIMGAVYKPGRYEWHDSMTFMDLLAHSGGPKQQANLSNIRIIKESTAENKGHEVQFFDLQAFTKQGSPTNLLPNLNASDTVIVDELPHDPTDNKAGWIRQAAKDSIYIFGEVGAPGRYAFNQELGFLDILSAADGPNSKADIQEILISHRNGKTSRVTRFDLARYFETGNEKVLPKVNAGDVIYVPKTESVADTKAVKVIGAVNTPGRYKWNSQMSFLDLLAMAGGPKQEANISNIRIIKESRVGKENVIYFDLESFINEGGNFAGLPRLEAGDTIVIDELPRDPSDNKASWIRQSSDDSIYVFGQVGVPGRYAFNHELGFLDILSAADGPNGEADLRQIRISHRDGNKTKVTQLNLSLYFETGDESLIPKVVPGDVIYVPRRQGDWLDKPAERVVRLMGAVNKPGRYSFNTQMNILDLLAEAGGPTDKAYIDRIMIVNTSCCGDKSQTFSLRDYVNDPSRSPLPLLRPGDTVYVPDQDDSVTEQFRQGIRDALGIITLIVLGAAL
ncbi:SLBB domain-containing protein [Photobacterium indicum]|uniref:Sugar ABC transporter substrate-binding protein n=1 Tax=Photobacterium indicum TaxID=81447 RepID=A0A2T3L6S5_9GAMM|nr:SLBB domain-containing protein [Photobacterium indicum]PSV45828.1 sugar ABC transporter substrate-binding protein [Photobacterium indicum]